jgi:bifunctional non-homologous end joining protein LigD
VLAEKHPDEVTTEQRKNKRHGRIYLDVMRNAYAQTAVTPYAVRALEGAPIATPLDWDELREADPQRYTIRNIFRRMGQKKDPWANMYRSAARLRF